MQATLDAITEDLHQHRTDVLVPKLEAGQVQVAKAILGDKEWMARGLPELRPAYVTER